MSYGGSSGSSKISTASDVVLSNPVTGDVLTYNTSLAKWENQAGTTGALQATNNLSDLSSASTARTNLGLGSAATQSLASLDSRYGSVQVLYVDAYGADHTGATDSTAAFVAAQTAGGSNPYRLVLSAGTYKIGTGSDLSVFGRNQGMTGQGSSVTKINYAGTGTAIKAYDATFDSTNSQGGTFGGFYLNGNSGATAGFSWGNLNTGRCNDIQIYNFNGANAIGLQFKNGASAWSEEAEWTGIKIIDCTNAVVFDTGSFDYSVYQFIIVALANQNGVVLQNSALVQGVRFELRGNFQAGTTNTGVALSVDPTGSGTTGNSCLQGTLEIEVESDGSTGVTHQSFLFAGSSASQIYGTGVFSFITGGSLPFRSGSKSGSLFGFSGIIHEPGLGTITAGDGLTIQGGTQRNQSGSLASNWAYNNMYLYCQFSDYMAFRLPNSAVTVAGFQGVGSRVRSIELLLQQPSAAPFCTITWPSNVKWAGGNHTLSASASAIDKVRLTYYPSEATWYGELLTAYS